MPFQESPRTEYEKNPLVEVVCQLRFPSELRLISAVPADFQLKIREHFPIGRRGQSIVFSLGGDGANPQGAPNQPMPLYEFLSQDKKWKVTVCPEFIALTTATYENWSNFKQRLKEVVESFCEIYAPTVFSRTGLRYRNVFRRSELNVHGKHFSELLAAQMVAPLLQFPSLESEGDFQVVAGLPLGPDPEQDGRVRMVSGLIVDNDSPSDERIFIVDNDFYVESERTTQSVWSQLDLFNKHSGHLFRSLITKELSDALIPKP